MQRLLLLLILACCLRGTALASSGWPAELRGAWLSRDAFASKASLAAAMETLAANNFNAVYVDVWSRGYPLWDSGIFHRHTGTRTDPAYGGRDILAEAIVEGHRVGLEVHAWFEYGFVGGWDGYYPGSSGKGPIFDAHPDWLARSSSGSDSFPAGSGNYYWLAHAHPWAQQFLIDLVKEVADRYDVDGIQFDRARYPSTDCGYDDSTRYRYLVERFRQVPADPNDINWLWFRADKLTEFVRSLYGIIKSYRPDITVSNTPVVHPYGLYNFIQDYPSWLTYSAVDLVAVQVYRDTAFAFQMELQSQISAVRFPEKIYPGIKASGVPTSAVSDMIRSTRDNGLKGFLLWHYGSLANHFATLKSELLREPAEVPERRPDWHRTVYTIEESSADAEKSGSWNSLGSGWNGGALFVSGSDPAAIRYHVSVSRTAWYQAYAFTTPSPQNTTTAHFSLRDSRGSERVLEVNQRSILNERWAYLGLVYLERGGPIGVVTVSNEGTVPGERLCADAILLVQTHLEPETVSMPYRLQLFSSQHAAFASAKGLSEAGHAVLNRKEGDAPQGFADLRTYSQSPAGRIVTSAAAVPAMSPQRNMALFAEINPVVNSGLALSNPGDVPATVQAMLRAPDGKVVPGTKPAILTIPPKQHLARFVYELFPGAPAVMTGSIWLTSDVPVGCITLRGRLNGRGEFLVTTMPLAKLDWGVYSRLKEFPQIADGGGYNLQLWLLNPTESEIRGYAAFFDSEGKPLALTMNGETRPTFTYEIPARGIQIWQSSGQGDKVQIGYAAIRPDSGSSTPLSSCIYSFRQSPGNSVEVAVPATFPGEGTYYVRRTESREAAEYPALAVANPNPDPAYLLLELRAEDGMRVLARAQTTLSPNSQSSRFLHEWMPGLPPEFRGVLFVQGGTRDGEVISIALQGIKNRLGDFMLYAIPSRFSMVLQTDAMVFPHLAVGMDYSSEITLVLFQSNARGALDFYRSNGQPWSLEIF